MSRNPKKSESQPGVADDKCRTEIRRLINAVDAIRSVDLERAKKQYRILMKKADYAKILAEEEIDHGCMETDIDAVYGENLDARVSPRETDESRNLRKRVTQLEAKLEEKDREMTRKERQLQELRENTELIHRQQCEESAGLSGENKSMKNRVKEMEGELERMKRKYDTALSDKEKTEREKNEALTRLSKSMGNKLSDNNPSIADLSDQNRATKLAEKFGELYDNEWTEAMEVLEKRNDEERAIEILLQVTKESFKYCKERAEEQMHQLEHLLVTPDTTRGNGDLSKENKKLLKDCRKASAVDAVDSVQKGFLRRFHKSAIGSYARDIDQYVMKCVELFWLMRVQDPPVTLGQEPSTGDTFDTTYYRHYTATGNTVKYVVWPPLLLYDGGPILSKGVAQPIKTEPRTRPATAPHYRSTYTKNTSYNLSEPTNIDQRGRRSVSPRPTENYGRPATTDQFLSTYQQAAMPAAADQFLAAYPQAAHYNTNYQTSVQPSTHRADYNYQYNSASNPVHSTYQQQNIPTRRQDAWGVNPAIDTNYKIHGATDGYSHT